MIVGDHSLTLLGVPHMVDAVAGISEHHGHPLMEGDLCLWVGGDALHRVTERAKILPYFAILEPADLWSVSGVAIYEVGTMPLVSVEMGNGTAKPGAWIGADQWWVAPGGLMVAHYEIMTMPYFLSTQGMDIDLEGCVRMRASREFDRVVWKPKHPSERNSLVEAPDARFATPDTQPLLLALGGDPVMWEWGLRCEAVDEVPPDWENPISSPSQEYSLRGAPMMDRAAEMLGAPPRPLLPDQAAHFARFWTIMQTAAAPASHLPRRQRRSLQRVTAKKPRSQPHMGNLWVVDIPRALPETSVKAESAGREHSYRYPVRGHWRNQWYPSIEGHKPIWIDEHARGPDTSPFHDRRVEWERDHPVHRLRIASTIRKAS